MFFFCREFKWPLGPFRWQNSAVQIVHLSGKDEQSSRPRWCFFPTFEADTGNGHDLWPWRVADRKFTVLIIGTKVEHSFVIQAFQCTILWGHRLRRTFFICSRIFIIDAYMTISVQEAMTKIWHKKKEIRDLWEPNGGTSELEVYIEVLDRLPHANACAEIKVGRDALFIRLFVAVPRQPVAFGRPFLSTMKNFTNRTWGDWKSGKQWRRSPEFHLKGSELWPLSTSQLFTNFRDANQ